MGTFVYGGPGMMVDFDDRFLAHAQLVIEQKLRRRETFLFSWPDDNSVGSGRSTVVLHASIPLVFRYAERRPVEINRLWLNLLRDTANAASGLLYVPEPGARMMPLPRSHV